MRMLNEEQSRTGKVLSLRSLLVLDALKKQRRLSISDLSAQLHYTDATIRATVESLVEAGLVEAHGSSTARTYMLSAKVYNAAGKNVDFVRQSDIDKARYPELIMKLARQQGGRVANRDVMSLLHLERKQAYRQLRKLVDSMRSKHRPFSPARRWAQKGTVFDRATMTAASTALDGKPTTISRAEISTSSARLMKR